MIETRPLPGWYPLMQAKDLRERPSTRTLFGTAVHLSRGPDGAPSARTCTDNEQLPAAAQDGWIFAALGAAPDQPPEHSTLIPSPFRALRIDGHVRAGIGDVGENILDTTHTSVVHSGYLRRPGARRAVEAHVTSGEDWVSASYPPGAAPSGWGARLLGAHRYTITDTFRAPGIAEVSYTDDGKPVFAARFRLTPVSARETYVAATLAVPGRGPLAAVKVLALRLFFVRIFAEDRAILELIGENRAARTAPPLVYAPQDLLRPGIDAVLGGRRPVAPPSCVLLKV
jgi:phenylpropionate dioxygenase-like ring-hydroxylating dioxygenase large terminal subunit